MIHSGKARRNYEVQKSRAKRQISYQQGRNPLTDGYEFDPAADPRFVAHMRNKQAQVVAKQTQQDIDAANTINLFVRIENVTV